MKTAERILVDPFEQKLLGLCWFSFDSFILSHGASYTMNPKNCYSYSCCLSRTVMEPKEEVREHTSECLSRCWVGNQRFKKCGGLGDSMHLKTLSYGPPPPVPACQHDSCCKGLGSHLISELLIPLLPEMRKLTFSKVTPVNSFNKAQDSLSPQNTPLKKV